MTVEPEPPAGTTDYEHKTPMVQHKFLPTKKVAIVSCPFAGGQGKAGANLGPHSILDEKYELVRQIDELGWDIHFEGHQQFEKLKPARDADPDIGKLKNPRYVSAVTHAVAKLVEKYCREGSLPLTLGGDHSLAIGTVVGVMAKYPDACLIWVDAHADANRDKTKRHSPVLILLAPSASVSGNIHGCPISFLTGTAEKIDVFNWVPSCLDWSRLAYIGLRDVDPFEKELLRRHNVAAYSMHHVDKYGIGKVIQMALARINPTLRRPIHLSFDVDAMDPDIAPSTGTPVRGGLTWREAMYICEEVAETGSLVAMDLVEVNPLLEDEKSVESTVSAACGLVRCALGESLL